jgi:OmpR family response regulator RpaB
MPHVLLIDDDERLAELLGRYFERFDLSLDSATRPGAGLAKLEHGRYDLVILDVMLPEMDGFKVCKAIRERSSVPVIMLTARGEVSDRVVGFELGADDYLPKPFEPRELVARIQAVLKRAAHTPADDALLQFGALVIDTRLREARVDQSALNLTAMEYQLLELLARHAGQTLSRDDILNHLKGIDTDVYSRAVDILISRLRHKLRPGDFIKTVRNSGYCFVGKSA